MRGKLWTSLTMDNQNMTLYFKELSLVLAGWLAALAAEAKSKRTKPHLFPISTRAISFSIKTLNSHHSQQPRDHKLKQVGNINIKTNNVCRVSNKHGAGRVQETRIYRNGWTGFPSLLPD
ncbi:hypothetical protein GQ457_10G024630 [Hibiscus cannabinus]